MENGLSLKYDVVLFCLIFSRRDLRVVTFTLDIGLCGVCVALQIRASVTVRRWSWYDAEKKTEKVAAESDSNADVTSAQVTSYPALWGTERHFAQPTTGRLRHWRYPGNNSQGPSCIFSLPPGRRWWRRSMGQAVPRVNSILVRAGDQSRSNAFRRWRNCDCQRRQERSQCDVARC